MNSLNSAYLCGLSVNHNDAGVNAEQTEIRRVRREDLSGCCVTFGKAAHARLSGLAFLLQDVTRDLDSIAEVFLVEDVADVVLHRSHAYFQFCGYPFIT
jgi:hypothetical protein